MDVRILGHDALRHRRRDADDLLQHLEVCVMCVGAGLDLAGVHAEGRAQVHALGPAHGGLVRFFGKRSDATGVVG